ncbi:helix-turn-helix transcriptional regulator [Thioclava sp. BHET1]|nr:helix-turn-helix transcriptional regulator [Thioclava sp. BHET1]
MRLRLKELRKERGWTGEKLASLAGTSKSYISDIENGRKFPSGRLLKAFARAFDVSVYSLIDDEDGSGMLSSHLEVMKDLSPEDQRAVMRHALGLLDEDRKSDEAQ